MSVHRRGVMGLGCQRGNLGVTQGHQAGPALSGRPISGQTFRYRALVLAYTSSTSSDGADQPRGLELQVRDGLGGPHCEPLPPLARDLAVDDGVPLADPGPEGLDASRAEVAILVAQGLQDRA